LVVHLIEHFMARGRNYIDLSVMHDNSQAIRLYESLGFSRVPVFVVKNRNRINEPLFVGHTPSEELNPYARIITTEARRRGIAVDVLDAERAYFSLSFGGRTVVCRESLSELTSAIAMSRCDDKCVTHRCLSSVGLKVPAQVVAEDEDVCRDFLNKYKRIVVKPSRGEQGMGVSVGITTPDELSEAVERASQRGASVVLEEMVAGYDLRIVVIDYRVVAAAIRRPPEITGDGTHTVRELIEKQSRRRSAATGGESTIPLDAETQRCVETAGHTFDEVLAAHEVVEVRKAANLHTGGTIHDVTDELHPTLVSVAKRAAEVLDIPVVGLDFIVPTVRGSSYWIIEANERPGLANHEPQPTAERFIDLLFPQTVSAT
jgi:GNAT-family acetyltransferase (TIGR03103 family)